MSRKDYEAIAALVMARNVWLDSQRKSAKVSTDYMEGFDVGYICALEVLANSMAEHFASENPRFDRERFLTACGF